MGEKGGTELRAASLSFMSLERAAEGGGGAQHAPRMRSSESRGMIGLDLMILLDYALSISLSPIVTHDSHVRCEITSC